MPKETHFDPPLVLEFWFDELMPADWYRKSDELDDTINAKFLPVYHAVVAGECEQWRHTDDGRLAEIIVLDQFSRNMFRDHADAFRNDPMALALAQEAIRSGSHLRLEGPMRAFMLMPYMHSESRQVHKQALALFQASGLDNNLEYEIRHKAIIDRFDRYPHRNMILGRHSTAEELEFLQQPGSSF